jgi:hypothetical protein
MAIGLPETDGPLSARTGPWDAGGGAAPAAGGGLLCVETETFGFLCYAAGGVARLSQGYDVDPDRCHRGYVCALHGQRCVSTRFPSVRSRDCVASISEEANDRALAHMATVLKAEIRPSTDLEFVQGEVGLSS